MNTTLHNTALPDTALPNNADVHVASFTAIPSPADVMSEVAIQDGGTEFVARSRDQVRAVMAGEDPRLLVIVGPCSIHDPEAGLEYADRLARAAAEHAGELLIVMRTYFEKPRTTVGWKGLINDPHLDGSHRIVTGLRMARAFLRDVNTLGMPCATEFLEPISPQYIADLVSWGAIGARTSESQIHRQLASGLSMPIGFKNGSDGDLKVAIDAMVAASVPQSFLGIGGDGRASLVTTTGNPNVSVVLRGGAHGPNFHAESVARAAEQLALAGFAPRLVVDASHDNSGKDHVRQAQVARDLAAQVSRGGSPIAAVMLESNLVAGAQKLDLAKGHAGLTRGQSVTDACMGWEVTEELLALLASAVAA